MVSGREKLKWRMFKLTRFTLELVCVWGAARDVQLSGGMGINSGGKPQVSVSTHRSPGYSAGKLAATQLTNQLPLF